MNAAQIARYKFRALWWQAVNRSLSERGKDEAIWLEIQWRFEYGLPIGAAILAEVSRFAAAPTIFAVA